MGTIQKNTPLQHKAQLSGRFLFSKMWRLVLVFCQVSLCMSAPQVCTNYVGESVPCANLLLNKFGLPVFDMTRVLHRERPCFNNDGDRVACYQSGNCDGGFHIPPTTEAPHHIEILQEGDECNATVFTETLPAEFDYHDLEFHTLSQTKMC